MANTITRYTVLDAMIACGVSRQLTFQGESQALRLARDLFGDNHTACVDKTFTKLDADFKTYIEFSTNHGQIHLFPGVKSNIKAYVQWVRDEVRLGRDPSTAPYPVHRGKRTTQEIP